MKTLIILSYLFVLSTNAFAQITKGQFLIGGNMNFESTKNNSRFDNYETTNYSISPNIGYFIINKMAIGMRVDFRSYNFKYENLETHQINTSLSPFLRYYLLPLQRKVNAFIDVSYIHEKSKRSMDSNPYVVKAKGYYISGGPSIFLTDQIALEFTLGYKHTRSDEYGETKVNKIISGFGLQIHLGKNKNKLKT